MADRAVVEQGINWVMSFVIGVVAIAFGLYLLIDSGNATTLIGAIIAFALLLGSLFHLVQGFRRNVNEFAARAALLSGGVGVTVGAIVALDLFHDYLSNPAARIILASGLIVYGVLGLASMFVQRVAGTVVRTIVTCLFALAFAALLIYNSQDDQLSTNWFAGALLVTGLLLLVLGFFARSHQQRLLQQRQPRTSDAPAGKRSSNVAGESSRRSRNGGQPVGSGAPAEPVTDRPFARRESAPVMGQATTGPRSDTATTPVASPTAQPASQPGQETRDRLLRPDGVRPDGTAARD